MKKLFAVLLALTLVLSMGITAFAADGDTTKGTITISNAIDGATYNIYKMFDFAPVDGSTTQGRYTVVAEWADFLAGEGAAYLKENTETGTIEWNGEDTDARKAELAKAAIAYAKDKKIAATATETAAADGAVTFANVDLGYYAIDTSLGTVCALTNVDNTFNAHEKNQKPEIDKQVQEDADDSWGKVNDAKIGQIVYYKSTITAGVGATNYVMHDKMDAGLTFNNDVRVELADKTVVDPSNYTVITSTTDGDTFDVVFEDTFIETINAGVTFTVYYSATLNSNAIVATDGNDNTVYLSYGEDTRWNTNTHTTSTFTWKIDVFKFTKEGDTETALSGATFKILNNAGKVITFSEVTGEAVPTYKVDPNGSITEITTNLNGKFEIIGLDEGKYQLEEIAAPAGYNKLDKPVDFTITSVHNDQDLTATYNSDELSIKVENKTGGLLPETGGIGTTIFYAIGGLLMVAAVVFLVSKKRMAAFA